MAVSDCRPQSRIISRGAGERASRDRRSHGKVHETRELTKRKKAVTKLIGKSRSVERLIVSLNQFGGISISGNGITGRIERWMAARSLEPQIDGKGPVFT